MVISVKNWLSISLYLLHQLNIGLLRFLSSHKNKLRFNRDKILSEYNQRHEQEGLKES